MKLQEINEKTEVAKDIIKDILDIFKRDKKKFENKIDQDDLVSGNIQKAHIIKFFKHLLREKHYAILVYEIVMLIIMGAISIMFSSFEYYDTSVFLGTFITLWGIPFAITHIALNGVGQNLLRIIVGAKPIERKEQIERIKKPVEAIIHEARKTGLKLPDDIDVYIMNYPEPIAYAIGMNTLVVTDSLVELKKDIFKAKIMSELHRINRMAPDYLLFMLGCNIISLILVAIVIFTSRIQMLYGDRRDGFWVESESKQGAGVFYLSIVFLGIWLGICYLLIRNYVRKNTFEADKNVAECGYGEALCLYLDQIMPRKTAKRYMLVEFGQPDKDERIAALQRFGVNYQSL